MENSSLPANKKPAQLYGERLINVHFSMQPPCELQSCPLTAVALEDADRGKPLPMLSNLPILTKDFWTPAPIPNTALCILPTLTLELPEKALRVKLGRLIGI